MTALKRMVYLGYYLRRMKWPVLWRFMSFVKEHYGTGRVLQALNVVNDSLRYNISPLEWYQFGFHSLDSAAKASWAGTGTMYEFQLLANPINVRDVLNDKRRFYRAYRDFFRHSLWGIEELRADTTLPARILAQNERLVFKDATGNCGASVQIHDSASLRGETLVDWMQQRGFDMVEACVRQHDALQALSPSGVNTVRIFTLVDGHGRYRVLGCRLRISVNSPVDNMAAGNLAAPIDDETGIVNGPGVYSDITKSPEGAHPVTGVPIPGFQLPYWNETLDLVRRASMLHPENRSIGWDVVITPDGPGLIEGNHDWCKLVWQLPVNRGLKAMLDGHALVAAGRGLSVRT